MNYLIFDMFFKGEGVHFEIQRYVNQHSAFNIFLLQFFFYSIKKEKVLRTGQH